MVEENNELVVNTSLKAVLTAEAKVRLREFLKSCMLAFKGETSQYVKFAVEKAFDFLWDYMDAKLSA